MEWSNETHERGTGNKIYEIRDANCEMRDASCKMRGDKERGDRSEDQDTGREMRSMQEEQKGGGKKEEEEEKSQ